MNSLGSIFAEIQLVENGHNAKIFDFSLPSSRDKKETTGRILMKLEI